MTGPFRIRAAAVPDAGEIARLSTALGYPASRQQIVERLAMLLPLPSQFIRVAAGDNGLGGWVAAERRLLLESGERVEIVGLVVDAAARRSGVGTSLVAAVEQWARRSGVGMIVVRSNIVRGESHPFYERIGFRRRKTQHVYARPVPPA